MNHPLILALLTFGGLYVAKLWRDDLRAARTGHPQANAFPGATPAPRRIVVIAVIGALALLALETMGEFALGIADEQSTITWLFALYSIGGAPIIEELIFRGWLVIEHRGRSILWMGAVAASLLFAFCHPFLWQWDEAGFTLTPTLKGGFSTLVLFASSIWFYAVRLGSWNPPRSLLPCFAAHAAKNLGVVAIKATSGFVVGLW